MAEASGRGAKRPNNPRRRPPQPPPPGQNPGILTRLARLAVRTGRAIGRGARAAGQFVMGGSA